MKSSFAAYLFFIITFRLWTQDLCASNIDSNTSPVINSTTKTDSLTLPVELIYFYASVQPQSILLKWGTATEVNNFGFEIERAHDSFTNWETVDFVLGNGTSNIPINYEYQDTTVPRTGIVYYRLKQVDVIGSFEYSDTVTVNFLSSITLENPEAPQEFSISNNFPNPFNPSTKINFQIPIQQSLKISLYDINGKLVKEIAAQEFLPGSYQLFLDFTSYSSGIYFVRFETQKNVVTKKITFIK